MNETSSKANRNAEEIVRPETSGTGRKLLYIMRHQGYVRNCEHAIRELARRGFSIKIAIAAPSWKRHDARVLEDLAAECPGVEFLVLPPLPLKPWDCLCGLSRTLVDYLRYFDSRYDQAPKLRGRIAKRVPSLIKGLFKIFPFLRRPAPVSFFQAVLRQIERAAPVNRASVDFLKAENPDVVLLTPLLDFDSDAIDYLKSALSLGIRTALVVASWDNLSNKGLIQLEPDRVILWNEIQKKEAMEMHRISGDRIVIAGAHLFDHWFEMSPGVSREEFCARAGLDPSRPFVLYACSSGFIAENEVAFIKKWIKALRNSNDPGLRETGILVRPHPGNAAQWEQEDLGEFANTAVWPRLGEGPVTPEAKANYFNSLYYCTAVVGINTSALVEAGILLKPVFTILDEEFRDTQLGTVHFHYLVQGGLLTVSRTLENHCEELAKAVGRGAAGGRLKDFIREFLRPHGLEVPGTPRVVSVIESLAAEGKTPPPKTPPVYYLLRVLLAPFALSLWVYMMLRYKAGRKSKKGMGSLLRHRIKRKHLQGTVSARPAEEKAPAARP